MDSYSSSRGIDSQTHQSTSSVSLSPTSAEQKLSNPDGAPAPKSNSAVPTPVVKSLKGFETQTFNIANSYLSHNSPILKNADGRSAPMQKFFERIEKNDRQYVQQLPSAYREREHLGIFIDHCHVTTGLTPLTAALQHGHIDLAVDLLLLGADPSVVDRNGRSPQQIASRDDMASMVIQFFQLSESLIDASSSGTSSKPGVKKDLNKLLIKIDIKTCHTLLTWSISKHHDELVEQLIDSGADIRVANRFCRDALEEACVSGSIATVCLLLDTLIRQELELELAQLIACMLRATNANRPMVLARLLSFFRDEFRLRKIDAPEVLEENPLNPIVSIPSTQQDAYRWFLISEPVPPASLDTLMHRTSNNFVLTKEESQQLRLNEIVAFAKDRGLNKIVEIIHAHARLPEDTSGSV